MHPPEALECFSYAFFRTDPLILDNKLGKLISGKDGFPFFQQLLIACSSSSSASFKEWIKAEHVKHHTYTQSDADCLEAVSVTVKRTLRHERLYFQPKNNDISSPVGVYLLSNHPDLSTMVFKQLMSVFEVDSH